MSGAAGGVGGKDNTVVGSPPRARGGQDSHDRSQTITGFTPARAGQTKARKAYWPPL